MKETFTEQQREIVARKMGYDGPMQMFDEYLASTPSDATKYAAITSKYVTKMARGGYVVKLAEGGAPDQIQEVWRGEDPPDPSEGYTRYKTGRDDYLYKRPKRETTPAPASAPIQESRSKAEPPPFDPNNPVGMGEATLQVVVYGPDGTAYGTPAAARAAGVNQYYRQDGTPYPYSGQPTGSFTQQNDGSGEIPVAPSPTFAFPATTDVTGAMRPAVTSAGTTQAPAAAIISPAEVKTVTAPTPVQQAGITAATAQAAVQAELDKTKAVQGAVSAQGQATAAQMEPTATAVKNLQAAQGTAAQTVAPAERAIQAGEMVSGSAVDQARVAGALEQNVAAQGVVTEDMTVSGQLNKLMTSFDAGAPPAWAASSMRSVTAQLAARGLGASSLAGQAIIQAALESAVPIAAADAKVFTEMGLTNLSNRQAMAIETAKQRAAFLGQEFDQGFQTKVLNAAKIADVANKNFDASVTIALENSRLANSMSIANLSSRNALVLAEAAQLSSLETANLNNRQQVAVDNAKAFLSMDLKNVDVASQTNLIKAQTIANAIVSDTSAQNAAKATNAANALEADKLNASLALTASQYNATEQNRVLLSNNAAVNEIAKFNATEKNNREEFNATMSNQINIANAKLLADISTANTREINATNAVNAKLATDMSASTYAQQMQTYRDLLEMSYKVGENDKDRLTEIATATITANASKTAAEIKSAGDSAQAWGQFIFKAFDSWKIF